MGRKGLKIIAGVVLFILFICRPAIYAGAEEEGEGVKKEVEGNVKIYWNALVNLDYDTAYAHTDCTDNAFWLSKNGSEAGKKDEDRNWFIVRYKIVTIKLVEANQALVVVTHLKAGPLMEGKYYTKGEVWRKRGKNWVRKCDTGF